METATPTVAVVGAGRIGMVHIANLLTLGATVKVVEGDELRAAAIREETGCVVLNNIAELDKVDGAVICVPTSCHDAVTRQLLQLGVPLLLEKPCTGDPVISAALGADADARGLPLLIGFQRRFCHELRLLRDAYTTRAAPIRWAHFVSLDGEFPPEEYESSATTLSVDLQIHDVDTVLWLFGQSVADVWAVETEDEGRCRPEQLVTTLVLADGLVCSLVCRRTNPTGCRVFAQLVGEQELLDTRDLVDPGLHADFRSRFASEYLEEARQFLRVLAGGVSALASWRDAVAAEDVCRRIDVVARSEGARTRC